jgi:hypothetical protein
VLFLLSEDLHRSGEHVTRTPLGPDELRRAGIDLQLAAQAQDLHVDAAIEDLLVMEMRGGEQLLAAQHLLRRSEERSQQAELANGELNPSSCR